MSVKRVRRRLSRALGLVTVALASACSGNGSLDVERLRSLVERPAQTETLPTLREETAPLAPPRSLRARGGELRAIPLAWEPVLAGDVAGYVIERALDLEEQFARVAVVDGRFTVGFVDRGADLSPKHGERSSAGLGDGETYVYRVRPATSDGRVGAEPSPTATATTAPTPAPPEDLRAWGQLPRRVALSWSASEEPHAAAYVVERSPSAGGPFEPVARVSGRFATHWTDTGLGSLRVFYYRVRAENAARGSGPPSEAVRAVTKPAPLPPIGLAVAERTLGANLLVWEPNVEPDLAGYRLFRIREGAEAPELVAEIEAGTTEAWDREVGAGERLEYRVVAFDRDGLASAQSKSARVVSVDYMLIADASPAGVLLRWSEGVQQDLAATRVLREGRVRARELGRADEPRFLDSDVEPGRRYRYRVIGVRPDGSEAPRSSPAEVEVPRTR